MIKQNNNKEEQIITWLETIQFDNKVLEKNILSCKHNIEDQKNLKKVQKLYHTLNIIKKVKSGKARILGIDRRKVLQEQEKNKIKKD